ncbi:hypothetical protein [Carboxylicivirga sp. M1479]|uniref:OmpL47-type beta-barrel domain-containing protein n=1 Tax=Carboxylicivirga sp. M1479 TaxID=2594476 RepID=UPI0011776CF6|nr:hypothetical protein [Carboxylicivirga sp. M1479]TRX71331.1 hypothetical protein FNN09_06985 [Carboxylicivirga sp. M1479]
MNHHTLKSTISLSALLFLFYSLSFSQEQPQFEMQHYTDTLSGKLYWNKNVPFSLKLVNPLNNDEVVVAPAQKQEIYFDSEGLNTIRSPWLINPQTKNMVYPQTEVVYKIFADGLPPASKHSLLNAPNYHKDGKTYYGTDLKININTKDATSGVKNLYYSINNEEYQLYSNNIGIEREGEYTLKYFAVDNVGNAEGEQTIEFMVDNSAPQTFHSVTGIDTKNNIISVNSKILLSSEDKASGVADIFYSIDDNKPQKYCGEVIPVKDLNDGEHVLSYYATDKVDNIEDKKVFKFYLDNTAPILSSDVLGDRFVFEDNIYFSGRTKLKLTAIDNKSGVKEIRYSIDNKDYTIYTEPFYLPSNEGLHKVKYYAIDNIDNITGTRGENGVPTPEQYKHLVVREIYSDLVGPSINHHFSGTFFATRDTVFICKKTSINLTATDKASGLQFISYSINKNKEEIRYKKPFTLEKHGLHNIEFFAYDNVNNRNKSSFYCYLDEEPPQIQYTFGIPPIGHKQLKAKEYKVYPSYLTIFLAANDLVIGVDKIYYSLNDGPEQLYIKPIEGFIKGQVNTLKIIAFDKLENSSVEEIDFFISN